jgi:hypothetical protein
VVESITSIHQTSLFLTTRGPTRLQLRTLLNGNLEVTAHVLQWTTALPLPLL